MQREQTRRMKEQEKGKQNRKGGKVLNQKHRNVREEEEKRKRTKKNKKQKT